MGVTRGRNHNDLVFEKSKVIRTDYSTVHQSLDHLVMGPAARNLQHTRGICFRIFIEQRQYRLDITGKALRVCTIAFLRGRGMQLTGEDDRAGAGAGTGVRLLPTKLQ